MYADKAHPIESKIVKPTENEFMPTIDSGDIIPIGFSGNKQSDHIWPDYTFCNNREWVLKN